MKNKVSDSFMKLTTKKNRKDHKCARLGQSWGERRLCCRFFLHFFVGSETEQAC